MACPSCGIPVATNALACPKYGHRFTHPFVKTLAIVFAICIVGVIVHLANTSAGSSDSATASAPKTAQQIEDDNYESAAGACMLWAEKNGPLLMGDLVDDYRLPRRKKDPKDVYRAGLHYRAKPTGLMMRADCSTLLTKDGKVMILEAHARAGQ